MKTKSHFLDFLERILIQEHGSSPPFPLLQKQIIIIKQGSSQATKNTVCYTV